MPSVERSTDFGMVRARSMLQTPRIAKPSLSSQSGNPQLVDNGSCTIYFGPEPPRGKEDNWVQTVPGKGWIGILRLYGPLESWFDKTWKPGEIESQTLANPGHKPPSL